MNADEVNEKLQKAADALQGLQTPWIIVGLLPDGSGRVISENIERWQEFSVSPKDARTDLIQLLDATVRRISRHRST